MHPTGLEELSALCGTYATGRNTFQLTHGPATNRYPLWSPDGRRIAFVSDRDGPAGRLTSWTIPARGFRRWEIHDSAAWPEAYNGAPFDWSPDGTQIAFVGSGPTSIKTVDVASGTVCEVVEGSGSHGYCQFESLCWRRSDGAILFGARDPSHSFLQDAIPVSTENWGGTRPHRRFRQVGTLHGPSVLAQRYMDCCATPSARGSCPGRVCAMKRDAIATPCCLPRSIGRLRDPAGILMGHDWRVRSSPAKITTSGRSPLSRGRVIS